MIKNNSRTSVLVAASLLTLTGAAAAQPTPLKPSELNSNPSHYDGQRVTVQGFVRLGPESHILYESEALDSEFHRLWREGGPAFNPRNYQKYCLTIANPDLLFKNKAKVFKKTLTLTGRFTSNYLGPDEVDLGACPLPTAILIDEADLKRRYNLR